MTGHQQASGETQIEFLGKAVESSIHIASAQAGEVSWRARAGKLACPTPDDAFTPEIRPAARSSHAVLGPPHPFL